MRLSKAYRLFGFTGFFVGTIGAIYWMDGGHGTAILQAIILCCSGYSLLFIALISALIHHFKILRHRFYNPVRRWTLKKNRILDL